MGVAEDVGLEPVAPSRRHGIGLRAQIIAALSVGFALSFVLLAIAIVNLGGHALDADRRAAAEATAEALLGVASLDEGSRRSVLEGVVGHAGIIGVEIDDGSSLVRVGAETGASVVTREQSGVRARVVLSSAQSSVRQTLPSLLILYVAVTAVAILMFSYVLLTRLIVGPVEELTRASERLASGRGEARVPIRGAAEVARLAVSFNHMQSQLLEERAALQRRLTELEETTRELRATQSSLVRSEQMASVGRLAAGVAHEIGNPLTSILGLVALVQEGELDPAEQREFLARVKKETERIHHIIRDLLDFARGDGSVTDPEETCDLVEVVEDAVRLVAPQKDLQAVTIERRFAEDCPRARGSAARLAQVVLNLLLNAADAIEGEGAIRLEVHPTPEGDRVELIVQDTGPGIPEAVRDHIFEPFVTSKPAGQGTGLGLAVCHTLIEQLDGSLEAENPNEGGARFVVRLPVAG